MHRLRCLSASDIEWKVSSRKISKVTRASITAEVSSLAVSVAGLLSIFIIPLRVKWVALVGMRNWRVIGRDTTKLIQFGHKRDTILI